MASLVAPLVSGISGAASGTAEFFRTGTAALAAVYEDAEGESLVTSHTLDAYGSIVRYVKERVDVVVKDTNAATVRTFTWGTDAREARLENLGFTGPDESGAIVPGGRTTVDAALTSLFESLGATDGNVLVNGSVTTLSLALSSSAGLVYNVKSGYGAVGDGVHNDAPNIQAAINAADAAGGGIIYFPHGTYLCGSGVTVANSTGKFFFLGEAATGSKIKQANATTMLTLGSSNENVLMNLTFTATSTNTGSLVAVGASSRALFISCSFDPLNGTHLALNAGSSTRAVLVGCTITQAGASSRIASGGGAYLRLNACDIVVTGTNMRCITDAVFTVSSGTNWSLGAAGSAGTTHVYNAAGTFEVLGGDLSCAWTSGTLNMMGNSGAIQVVGAIFGTAGAAFNAASTGATLIESSCIFGSGCSTGIATAGFSQTRDHNFTASTITAASYTPSGAYMIHEVSSNNAAFTLNNPSPAVPVGSGLVVLYRNTNGAAVTPAFDTQYQFCGDDPVVAVNSNNSSIYYFVAKFSGTVSGGLVCVSAIFPNGRPIS